MQPITREHEIAALRAARVEVELGRPYICVHIQNHLNAPSLVVAKELTGLIDEVEEFLDKKSCVEDWLNIHHRWGVVKQYRLAIIDTLLARRGVTA